MSVLATKIAPFLMVPASIMFDPLNLYKWDSPANMKEQGINVHSLFSSSPTSKRDKLKELH